MLRGALTVLGAKALATNTNIRTLKLADFHLVPGCLLALGNSKTLTKLSIRYSLDVRAEDIHALLGIPTLIELDLSTSGIEDSGAVQLANEITNTSSLKRLILGQNSLPDVGAQALAANTALEHLDLQGNHITAVGALAFAQNTTLKSISLLYNPFFPESAREVETALGDRLQRLEL